MKPEEWHKLSSVLDQVLDLPAGERTQFLAQLRRDDPQLCSEVEALLEQQLTNLLEGPPTRLFEAIEPIAAPSEMPKQLGAYRVVKILGAGGMGVVYEAEDPTLERRVALKVMKQEHAAWPQARERFLREARSAAALHHDHVLPIYHVGEEAGVVFLVMPLLQGETLEDRLVRTPNLPVGQILRVGREIAEGLAAAHGRGLVHRDIKPANVWLESVVRRPSVAKDSESGAPDHGLQTTDSRVKIMDFGLARATAAEANLTQSGMILGTPAYMSPEQGRGEDVDGRSDLFSLGCVLYRMCTGTPPFQRKDALSTMLAAATETPAAPSDCNRSIPVAVSDLILKLLAKSPADRFQSAQQVADRLKSLGDTGVFSTLRTPMPASRLGQKARPTLMRRLALGTALLMPLLIFAAVYVIYVVVSKENGRPEVPGKQPPHPPPNTIVPRTGTLIFKDDFGADIPTPIFVDFKNIGGRGQLTTSTPGVVGALYTKETFKDFAAELDIEPLSAGAGRGYGLFFRADANLRFYYYVQIDPGEKKICFRCWQHPSWTEAKDYPLGPAQFKLARSNRLRLEALGDEFRVFVNGVFVCQVVDARIAGQGILGLSATSTTAEQYTVYYQALRVYRLEATGANGPTLTASLSTRDWLAQKTREQILTVAQDGSGQYRTIGAAIDALKPGQVVKVLDNGPYREELNKLLPEDVGLVSEVGTRLEVPKWQRLHALQGGYFYRGAVLTTTRGARLAGFEIIGPALEADSIYSALFTIVVGGEVLVESCRFLHQPAYPMAMPPPGTLPASLFTSLHIEAAPRPDNHLAVRNNLLHGAIVFSSGSQAPAFSHIERNQILSWRQAGIILDSRSPGTVMIRHNVIQCQSNGVAVSRNWYNSGYALVVTNNLLEQDFHPLGFDQQDADAVKLRGHLLIPAQVRFQNNVVRSTNARGIGIIAEAQAVAQKNWHVGHNCFQAEPAGSADLPRQPTDLVRPAPFLSEDPKDLLHFKRIAADSPLGNAGAGGDLPAYIGPFPPGPAPKEGDWFTRLLAGK